MAGMVGVVGMVGMFFFSSEVLNIWKIGWEKYDVD